MAIKQSKKAVAQLLSTLKGFKTPRIKAEQYATDSEVAGDALWQAFMHGDIEGKTIADLGSGTGILGMGALLLGAKKVFLVEKDEAAMKISMDNFEIVKSDPSVKGAAEFLLSGINDFNKKIDVVVENPPFGTKARHADREFLEKAFEIAPVVYSFHKTSTEKFVKAFSDDKGFRITHRIDYAFPLKKTHEHHRRRVHRINVSLFRMEKSRT